MLNIFMMNMIIFVGRKDKEGVLEHKVMKLSLGVLLSQTIHKAFLRPFNLPTW